MAKPAGKEKKMLTEEMIKTLQESGFNRWTKNGMDRLYVNASALGLNCTYYKTGNISSAEFRGNSVSNCEARRLKAAKTYIDVKHNKIISDSCRLSAAVAEDLKIDYHYGDTIIDIP